MACVWDVTSHTSEAPLCPLSSYFRRTNVNGKRHQMVTLPAFTYANLNKRREQLEVVQQRRQSNDSIAGDWKQGLAQHIGLFDSALWL